MRVKHHKIYEFQLKICDPTRLSAFETSKMLKYLTHKLKTQSINEENPNEKVSGFSGNDYILDISLSCYDVLERVQADASSHENFPALHRDIFISFAACFRVEMF